MVSDEKYKTGLFSGQKHLWKVQPKFRKMGLAFFSRQPVGNVIHSIKFKSMSGFPLLLLKIIRRTNVLTGSLASRMHVWR
jgi:hypothetical protein